MFVRINLPARVLTSVVALSATLFTHSSTASAASSATSARCSVPSANAIGSLVKKAVQDDLTSKGHTVLSVIVGVKGRSGRTVVKLSNIIGLTSVNAVDGGYSLVTTQPLSVPCAIEATVTIKGIYKDKTSKARTSFGSTQKVTFDGAFN